MSWYFRQVMGQRSTQLGLSLSPPEPRMVSCVGKSYGTSQRGRVKRATVSGQRGREREYKGKGFSGEIKDEERPGELKQMKLHTFPLLVCFEFAQRLTTGLRKWVVQT